MDAFEKWVLTVTHEEIVTLRDAWNAGHAEGFREGMRRAAKIAHDKLDDASWRAQALFARDAILRETDK